ncbi:uncharacterized protein PgNI_04446 [Pyricularia grisea]|uniref:Major facilitator superfamily (MFS) profile domain-containing protein n=1 Tax=Pyricularia grisea TaxID=148305 RepID=A0A6P8BAM7_PYRGI|nr:uncharacterized protein PgNI_04446 [Pyricularia grisea]TLD12868.1 hypothetical protein PgNI_04446 [Pyricularia grisea]
MTSREARFAAPRSRRRGNRRALHHMERGQTPTPSLYARPSLPCHHLLPLVDLLARRYHVSTHEIKLTITIYVLLQGIVPVIWSPLSETWRRRPVYLATFGILNSASLGFFSVDRDHCALGAYIPEALQGVDGSTILAIGYAPVSDFAMHSERSRYFVSFLTAATLHRACRRRRETLGD